MKHSENPLTTDSLSLQFSPEIHLLYSSEERLEFIRLACREERRSAIWIGDSIKFHHSLFFLLLSEIR